MTAQVNLVENGSFENPQFNLTLTDGSPYFYYGYIPPNSLVPWRNQGTTMYILESRLGGWIAQDGTQYVEVDNFSGFYEQTLNTTPGTTYTLKFWYAPQHIALAHSADDALRVKWNGVVVGVVDGTAAVTTPLAWTQHTYTVTATGPSTVLRFEDGGLGYSYTGGFLDNVSVTSLCEAPKIKVQPASLEVCAGSTRTLSVGALGTAPLTYRWYRNGVLIANSNASSYTLSNISSNDQGNYTCVVSNPCGIVSSATATITVHPYGPNIIASPTSLFRCVGTEAIFMVEALPQIPLTPLEYQWFKTNADGTVAIGPTPGAPTLTVAVNGLSDEGSYTCRVTEPGCGVLTTDPAVLTVNRAPIAVVGEIFSVDEGQPVELDGSGSSDPENGPLTYAWVQVSGIPPVVLSDPSAIQPTFTAPNVALSGGTLTFKLTVTDGCQSSSEAVVSVTVVNVNHPPVAEAGEDQSVAEGSPVTLHGEDSCDIDADFFSFTWVQMSGPTVILTGADTANPTFVAPVITGSALGVVATLVFKLSVSDGFFADAPAPGFTFANVDDEVTIEITNVNNVPTANAGQDQTVNENASVSLSGVLSTDPDQDPLTYAWVQVGGPSVMLVSSGPTDPTTTFTAPFVNTGGAVLTFGLTVNDGFGGISMEDTVTVNVQNFNDPPLASAARPSQALLWPPNHGMVAISILGVTDPNNNATIEITGVTQDEPTEGLGDGDTPVDAIINPNGTVLIRAERAGNGNGRVYRIHFTASDLEGSTSGVVKVSVPHNKKSVAVDSMVVYPSTGN